MNGAEIQEAVLSATRTGNFAALDWFLDGLDPKEMTEYQIVTLLHWCWHVRDVLNVLPWFHWTAQDKLGARAEGLLVGENWFP